MLSYIRIALTTAAWCFGVYVTIRVFIIGG
jgi:hypothetical protein